LKVRYPGPEGQLLAPTRPRGADPVLRPHWSQGTASNVGTARTKIFNIKKQKKRGTRGSEDASIDRAG